MNRGAQPSLLVRLAESNSGDGVKKDGDGDNGTLEQQTEYLASTRDPFSYIRIAVWALLGLGGLAGIATTFISAGGILQSLTNFVINVIVTVAMAGALYFEFQLGAQSRDVVREEMNDPRLKGGSDFFMERPRKTDDVGSDEAPLVPGQGPPDESD